MLADRGASNLWPDIVAHERYDAFWQARAIRHHLNNVRCPVLVTGGWFDCEDPLGPFAVFEETTRRNPRAEVCLCVGPWAHAQWSGGEGLTRRGNIGFGSPSHRRVCH
jgi:predicted acyl esterase